MRINTTLGWIWFWGILTVVFVESGTDWGLIASTITVFFVVGGTFYGIAKWYFRKKALRELATVNFDFTNGITQTQVSDASANSQSLQVTIIMKADTNVERIRFCFKGEGNLPKIQNLYDWSFGGNWKSTNVEVKQAQYDDWYWDYYQPLHRSKNSRVTIGIKYLAESTFKGFLEIGLTCVTAAKLFRLPVEIKIQ